MSKFDIDFQNGILSLVIKDIKFLSYASAHLKPSFFDTNDMSWAFSVARDHYMNYRSCLTKRSYNEYLRKSYKKKEIDKRYSYAEGGIVSLLGKD